MQKHAGDRIPEDWLTALRGGDWESAWRLKDRVELPRRVAQRQPGFRPAAHHLRWDGTPFEGRRVLVRCLHGLGDTLQFARFVPLLTRVAREVHFLVQPQLLGLLGGAPGLGHLANAWTDAEPPGFDVELEVMELPYALRLRLEDLPPPYALDRLPVCGERVALSTGPGCRVGLIWAAGDADASRSVPPHLLASLADLPGVELFGLQQGRRATPRALRDAGLVELSSHTQPVENAARAMRSLDLVVSIDGMTAHLAGSVGVPTWLLLKRDADWRWMENRDDSPWYPRMRLFRQQRAGDWESAVRALAEALAPFAASVPVALTTCTGRQPAAVTMTLTGCASIAQVIR